MHATGTYTTAETPNHMETTRILAPKWLITRNRRPSPENATNIPDFREKIQGFILIQRARVDPARHTRTRSDTMFALVTSSAAVRANAPAQFKRNVSARCVSSDARRDARSRDAGRRDDATHGARWAPLCVTRARARGRARDARANATRRASKREKYGGATRARAGRGASRRKFSRRRRRGVDDAATSTMLTRMTRMTRTASSRSREDGREGSTTSRRRETAED